MDTNDKNKPAPAKKPELEPREDDEQQSCTKPFDSESARSGDKDAPCNRGEG